MMKKWMAAGLLLWGGLLAAAVLTDDFTKTDPKTNIPLQWHPYRRVVNGASGIIRNQTIQQRPTVVMDDNSAGEIGIFREFPAKPGEYWYASVMAALPPGGKPQEAFVIQLTFMGPNTSQAVRLDVEDSQFRRFEVSAQAPAGTKAVRCYIYSHRSPTGAVAIRDCKVDVSHKPFELQAPINWRFLQPAQAKLNKNNVELTPAGAIIKAAGKSAVGKKGAEPDLVFRVKTPRPGLYGIQTVTSVDAIGAELMVKAKSKFESMAAQFQIDNGRPTNRYIFVPWSRPQHCNQALGYFYFNGKPQDLKIWLPEHCALKTVNLSFYKPFPVPAEVRNYKPAYVPPKTRPRIWVNAENLPNVRSRLNHPEHKPFWQQVSARARKPMDFRPDPDKELKFNPQVETAMVNKAFYYLMTGDKTIGREAVQLALRYMELVEFGNLLDITREIGRAIYSASCVYDWCYSLITPAERDLLRTNLLRLARDMECAWPPFRQSIVNGHGNELQVTRDLLSMSIAIYDEDPEPYKYCSYKILEQLVPMRKFEYQSPRHNQGVSYGSFRFPCDLRAALLFRQMLGKPVFDDNINSVPLYWFYMRTPSGTMLRDGDGVSYAPYWSAPELMFHCLAYGKNPLVKGEFLRQSNGRYPEAALFLLLNDPEVKAKRSLESLPLTMDFGPVLAGMIARTGWYVGSSSSDVVAEIKGGGYIFGGHQHADSGSFQIYYRGFLAAKLGLYHFYGTPYDMNFAKRSIAQSMMLVRDPAEKIGHLPSNDGGMRLNLNFPRTPEDTMKNFRAGKKLYCTFGPSAKRPYYSSFAADLTGAYSSKIRKYIRSFHFFNMEDTKIPAVIIVSDQVTSADPAFRKYWQINTLQKPEITGDGAILTSKQDALTGKMYLSMPIPAEREVKVYGGKDAHNVFGKQYMPPNRDKKTPEANGYRIQFSPRKAAAQDAFLVIMQITDGTVKPMPVQQSRTDVSDVLAFGNRVVSISHQQDWIRKSFAFTVQNGAPAVRQILVTGLAAGPWSVKTPAGTFTAEVQAGKNSIFLTGGPGRYEWIPGKLSGAAPLPDYSKMEPANLMPDLEGAVLRDGKRLPGVRIKKVGNTSLVPAEAALKALGAKDVKAEKGLLKAVINNEQVAFYLESGDVTINGSKLSLNEKSAVIDGKWYLPIGTVALANTAMVQVDRISDSVTLTPMPEQLRHIGWITSKHNANISQLQNMLIPRPGKTWYWDAEGAGAGFEVGFRQVMELNGVGIAFMQGSRRTYKFDIEVSNGGPWEKVFSGRSSGKTDEVEYFRFPVRKVQKIRFTGGGNSENQWNSIYTFVPLEKK